MKKLYRVMLLVLLCQLPAATAVAQKVVRGTVRDKAGKSPIPMASVVVEGTAIGVATDSVGAFRLILPQDTVRLKVYSIGYVSRQVAVEAGDSIVVLLKTDCSVDFFYNRYIGVGLSSGLKYKPLGASVDVFYPHLFYMRLWNNPHFRPAIRLQAGYQTGRAGQQRFASVGLNQLFVTCGYNLNAALEYQAIQLEKASFGFSRRSFVLEGNNLLWRGSNSLAIGKAKYQLAEQRYTSYGVEVGTSHWVDRKLSVTIREKIAWWGTCWQFQLGAEKVFKYGWVGANFNKIGRYEEVNLVLGARWAY